MNKNPALKIEELDVHSPHILTAGKWLNAQWGYAQGYSLAETTDWCISLASAKDQSIFAATRGNQILGTALVVECDLAGYEHLKPWISGLYVTKSARGNEIGSFLIDAACDWASHFGYEKIYLYAQDGALVAYYLRLGWAPMLSFNRDGESHKILSKPLTEASA